MPFINHIGFKEEMLGKLMIPDNTKFNSSLNEIDIAMRSILLSQARIADPRNTLRELDENEVYPDNDNWLWDETRVFQTDELEIEDIDQRIQDAFEYDEYKWQKERNIHITYEGRAEGLHKVLYKCPHCGKEYKMNSKGIYLYCEECGKKWEYSELGELKAVEGETEFSHIPDWYEWERDEVRKEVEAGTYHYEGEVHVDLLPKDKFFHLGKGYLIHDMNGFKLTGEYEGEKYEAFLDAKTHYGVHIEYEYLGKFGDCVDLNTLTDTFYVYPHGKDFAVTKFFLYSSSSKLIRKCS